MIFIYKQKIQDKCAKFLGAGGGGGALYVLKYLGLLKSAIRKIKCLYLSLPPTWLFPFIIKRFFLHDNIRIMAIILLIPWTLKSSNYQKVAKKNFFTSFE